MKIAIDFDGVVCKREGIPTLANWTKTKPVEGALNSIILLQELGHEVWILTSNPDLDAVNKWLSVNNFPRLEVTNIRRPANVYIDDRAIRFTNWQDIRKYFS